MTLRFPRVITCDAGCFKIFKTMCIAQKLGVSHVIRKLENPKAY